MFSSCSGDESSKGGSQAERDSGIDGRVDSGVDSGSPAVDAGDSRDAASSGKDAEPEPMTDPEPDPEPGCPKIELNYAEFADAFFAMNCRSCHSASKTGAARIGAPVNINFDSEPEIITFRDRIRKAAIDEKRMPPGTKLSDCSIERLDGYLDSLPDPACQPDCQGKQCGDDGCGGSCGSCEAGKHCDENQCAGDPCEPQCDGASCGPDGCGGTCGECTSMQMCTTDKQCACVPSCSGKSCGPDGCGDTCGSCDAGTTCDAQGSCVCSGSCQGKQCGDDGCGNSCGQCPGGSVCNTAAGMCQATCSPSCNGRSCGDDGCGGSCGDCTGGLACNAGGQCVCMPSCTGRQCGADGCGGSCGSCTNGTCNASGQCIPTCSPSCGGRQCGDNGCGGSCGNCPGGQTCSAAGICVAPAINFATDVYPIFAAASCGNSNCHGGSAPARGLNLSNATVAQSMLVNVAADECGDRLRVAPGNPNASYLISKLTGVDMCSGERMPRGGSPLSNAQIDTIRAWITGL